MTSRVLIIDDDTKLRKLLHEYLEENGFQVFSLEDGSEALPTIEKISPDIVILDVMMPGIGGLELLRQMRRSSANMATPVLIVSVLADRETVERCRDAGADGHLAKPVEERKLTAAVRKLLAGRGKTRIP